MIDYTGPHIVEPYLIEFQSDWVGANVDTGNFRTADIAAAANWLPAIVSVLGTLVILVGFTLKMGTKVNSFITTVDALGSTVKELKASTALGFTHAHGSRKTLRSEQRTLETRQTELAKDQEHIEKMCAERHAKPRARHADGKPGKL